MRNKILGALLITAAFFTVGCGKNEKKVEDTTPKVVCTAEENSEGMKSTAVTTITIRDDKKYVKDYISEIKVVVEDESTYKLYKEAVQNEEEEPEEGVEYTKNFDDANKTISYTIKITLTDEKLNSADADEKEEMEVKYLVQQTEKSGGKCEFKNISRSDIGL